MNENQNTANEVQIEIPVGAAWAKTTKNGKTYFTGKIELNVVMFINENATEENKQPTLRIIGNAPRRDSREATKMKTSFKPQGQITNKHNEREQW